MRDCLCQVCGDSFQHPALPGRRIQAYNLCEKCVAWHKYCSKGQHFPLRSTFAPTGDGRSDGLQTSCNDCLAQYRGRILSCTACDTEFLVQGNSQRHNGRAIPLCDDCYGVVKYCGGCNEIKTVDGFGDRIDRADGKKSHCKECLSQAWREMPVEEQFAKTRGVKYGISYSDYLAMQLAQGGFCAICNSPETDIHSKTGEPQRLAVDHCHATGLVRSLLCGKCNKAIGLFGDDIERLESAIDYLKKWKSAHADSMNS